MPILANTDKNRRVCHDMPKKDKGIVYVALGLCIMALAWIVARRVLLDRKSGGQFRVTGLKEID